jgi:plastocyanin
MPFRSATAVALSFAIATSAIAQPSVQRIDIQNFSFMPRPIHLAAGTPVTLSFVNRSGGGHDFTAPEFFGRSTIVAGSAAGGKIALPGHSTRMITLVPSRGTYKAHCSHFLHSTFGMTDLIVVD